MFTQKFGEPLSWNVKENDQKTKSLTIFNDNFSNTFQKKKRYKEHKLRRRNLYFQKNLNSKKYSFSFFF
jgi:hypothetical protein